MVTFLLRRLIYMVITMFVISIISFMLVTLPKGSALDAELNRLRAQGGNLPEQQIEQLKIQYGVDDPWYVQYKKWAGGMLHGDFGESFTQHQPVTTVIGSRVLFSIGLTLGALVFGWVVSIPVGVYSATHRYNAPDYVITVIQFIGVSIPEFLLALIALVFAAKVLNLSVGGLYSTHYQNAPWSGAKFLDLLAHLWIPIIVIGAGSTAWLTRVMRGNLLDVLNSPFVQTARAKGVKESRVIWKHAVRNAINPLIMALGTSLPTLISGEAIVSIVLNLPTMGPIFILGLQNQDMYLAVTILMIMSLLAWVDPRARNIT